MKPSSAITNVPEIPTKVFDPTSKFQLHIFVTPYIWEKKLKKKLDNRKTEKEGKKKKRQTELQEKFRNKGQSVRGEGWILQYDARSTRLRLTILK